MFQLLMILRKVPSDRELQQQAYKVVGIIFLIVVLVMVVIPGIIGLIRLKLFEKKWEEEHGHDLERYNAKLRELGMPEVDIIGEDITCTEALRKECKTMTYAEIEEKERGLDERSIAVRRRWADYWKTRGIYYYPYCRDKKTHKDIDDEYWERVKRIR